MAESKPTEHERWVLGRLPDSGWFLPSSLPVIIRRPGYVCGMLHSKGLLLRRRVRYLGFEYRKHQPPTED